ncbi:Hypothetical predicted protein, partial [Pelobates cultripes]
MTDIAPTPSPKYPIADNPLFMAGKGGMQLTPQRRTKKATYITLAEVVGVEGKNPVTQLTEGKIPTLMQRFQYGQMRHILTAQGLSGLTPRDPTRFERLCLGDKSPPKQTSLCYKLLQTQ